MLYYATTSALHRPWAVSSEDQSKSRVEWRKMARTKIQEAAAGITNIIQKLNQLNLIRFLPQSGVTVILPAAVAHLSNYYFSNDLGIRESSIYNFQLCIQALELLKDIYPVASMEVANLKAATKLHSGNDNSSVLFQAMRYNLDTTPGKFLQNPRKPSNPHLMSNLHPLHQGETLTQKAETPPSRPEPVFVPDNENQSRRVSTNTSPKPSQRPFPNDFDRLLGDSNNSSNDSFGNTFC
jgi:hypothetical protein